MKAADITDEQFCRAVDTLSRRDSIMLRYQETHWVMIHELCEHFGVPRKIIQAKLKKCCKRKLVDGCWCGCRGDVYLLPAGKELLRGQ